MDFSVIARARTFDVLPYYFIIDTIKINKYKYKPDNNTNNLMYFHIILLLIPSK